MTPDRSAGISLAGEPQRVAIVPVEPGPVRLLADALGADDFVDPIDEPADPADRPGRSDALLIAVGIVLAGAGLILPMSVLVTIGIISVVLGLALPLQAGVRAVRGRQVATRTRKVLGRGYPFDLHTRESRALIAAYERVLAVTEGAGGGHAARIPASVARDARASAHRALVEAASLLEGRAPTAAAELAYLRRRTDGMTALAGSLTHEVQAREDAEQADLAGAAGSADRAAALAMAREELDAETGLGSLDEMAEITDRLRRARGDDDLA